MKTSLVFSLVSIPPLCFAFFSDFHGEIRRTEGDNFSKCLSLLTQPMSPLLSCIQLHEWINCWATKQNFQNWSSDWLLHMISTLQLLDPRDHFPLI